MKHDSHSPARSAHHRPGIRVYITLLLIIILASVVLAWRWKSRSVVEASTPRSLAFRCLPSDVAVWDIETKGDATAWLGTSSGIYTLDSHGKATRIPDKSNREVRDIEEILQPSHPVKLQTWLATDRGLFWYRTATGVFQRIGDTQGMAFWDIDQSTDDRPRTFVATNSEVYELLFESAQPERSQMRSLGLSSRLGGKPLGRIELEVISDHVFALIPGKLMAQPIDSAASGTWKVVAEQEVHDIDEFSLPKQQHSVIFAATSSGLRELVYHAGSKSFDLRPVSIQEAFAQRPQPANRSAIAADLRPAFAVAKVDDSIWLLRKGSAIICRDQSEMGETNLPEGTAPAKPRPNRILNVVEEHTIFSERDIASRHVQSSDLDYGSNLVIFATSQGAFILNARVDLELSRRDGKSLWNNLLSLILPEIVFADEVMMNPRVRAQGQTLDLPQGTSGGISIRNLGAKQSFSGSRPLQSIVEVVDPPRRFRRSYQVTDSLGNKATFHTEAFIAFPGHILDHKASIFIICLIAMLLVCLVFAPYSWVANAFLNYAPARYVSSLGLLGPILVNVPPVRIHLLKRYTRTLAEECALGRGHWDFEDRYPSGFYSNESVGPDKIQDWARHLAKSASLVPGSRTIPIIVDLNYSDDGCNVMDLVLRELARKGELVDSGIALGIVKKGEFLIVVLYSDEDQLTRPVDARALQELADVNAVWVLKKHTIRANTDYLRPAE